MLKGIIIENSLDDLDALGQLQVEDTRQEGDWTVHTVTAPHTQIPDIARCLKDGPWYMHFWDSEGDELIVVYKTRTFRASRTDPATLEGAKAHGRSIGIPEEELDFTTD